MKKVKRVKKVRRVRSKFPPKTKKYTIGSSKVEKEFGVFLKSLGFEVESQYQIAYKYYDFKIKGKDILLEFDGEYYHWNQMVHPDGPINQMQIDSIQNDKYKDTLARCNGFKIIRIWESEFRKNKEKLKLRLLKEIK